MKTTFKFIIAAMAAVSVFSSCQKELAKETVNNTTDGVRTIAVQFDNSTKATLDGFTPKFANGDAIRVSNTEKSEECTVSVDGSGNATFTTTLSGALTAIYPSAAAVLSSGEADAPIATSNNIKVPASQDGDVAKAIIAKAEIADGSTSATFTSQTALFEITPPSTAKKITVTSLKKVESGSRTGTVVDINTEDTGKTVITVGDGSADLPSTIYVALVPGVNLTDLSFDAGENIGLKGIPTNILSSYSDQTAANTKYTIGNTNWHPYVEIQMNSKTYKWATMNVGANSATEAGKYFAWGDIVGQTPSGSTFSTSFDWAHAPFNNGKSSYDESYFASVKDSESPGGILALKNDAANVNWGGSWRMPTKAEFDALKSLKRGKVASGYYFGTSDDAQIFLPAAGYGNGALLLSIGNTGCYWSSSLDTDNPSFAYDLYFFNSNADTGSGNREYGQSVRALSE